MKRVILCGLLALPACQRGATPPSAAATAVPRTDDEKAFYSLGVMMGQRIGEFNLSAAELDLVKRGLTDSVNGTRPVVEIAQYGARLGQLAQTRQTARAQVEKRRGQEFAAQAAREPGAQRLPSGLIYRELRAGTGPQPAASDTVTVNYRGTLTNGTEFDSSYARHEPATFPLQGVIPCWTEGVQKMKVGGKAKLVCPSDIAYGDRGQRQIPPGSTLVFEIELVSIRPPEAAPPGGPSLFPGGMGLGGQGIPGGLRLGGPRPGTAPGAMPSGRAITVTPSPGGGATPPPSGASSAPPGGASTPPPSGSATPPPAH